MQVSVPRTGVDGLELRLEGFHGQSVDLVHDVNGWVFGNIIFGGLVGLIIDLTTGNSTKLATTTPLHVVLVPGSRPAPIVMQFPAGASRRLTPNSRTYKPAQFGGYPESDPWSPADGPF